MLEETKDIPNQCYDCDWRKPCHDGWFCNHPASDKKVQIRHPYCRLKECPLITTEKTMERRMR